MARPKNNKVRKSEKSVETSGSESNTSSIKADPATATRDNPSEVGTGMKIAPAGSKTTEKSSPGSDMEQSVLCGSSVKASPKYVDQGTQTDRYSLSIIDWGLTATIKYTSVEEQAPTNAPGEGTSVDRRTTSTKDMVKYVESSIQDHVKVVASESISSSGDGATDTKAKEKTSLQDHETNPVTVPEPSSLPEVETVGSKYSETTPNEDKCSGKSTDLSKVVTNNKKKSKKWDKMPLQSQDQSATATPGPSVIKDEHEFSQEGTQVQKDDTDKVVSIKKNELVVLDSAVENVEAKEKKNDPNLKNKTPIVIDLSKSGTFTAKGENAKPSAQRLEDLPHSKFETPVTAAKKDLGKTKQGVSAPRKIMTTTKSGPSAAGKATSTVGKGQEPVPSRESMIHKEKKSSRLGGATSGLGSEKKMTSNDGKVPESGSSSDAELHALPGLDSSKVQDQPPVNQRVRRTKKRGLPLKKKSALSPIREVEHTALNENNQSGPSTSNPDDSAHQASSSSAYAFDSGKLEEFTMLPSHDELPLSERAKGKRPMHYTLMERINAGSSNRADGSLAVRSQRPDQRSQDSGPRDPPPPYESQDPGIIFYNGKPSNANAEPDVEEAQCWHITSYYDSGSNENTASGHKALATETTSGKAADIKNGPMKDTKVEKRNIKLWDGKMSTLKSLGFRGTMVEDGELEGADVGIPESEITGFKSLETEASAAKSREKAAGIKETTMKDAKGANIDDSQGTSVGPGSFEAEPPLDNTSMNKIPTGKVAEPEGAIVEDGELEGANFGILDSEITSSESLESEASATQSPEKTAGTKATTSDNVEDNDVRVDSSDGKSICPGNLKVEPAATKIPPRKTAEIEETVMKDSDADADIECSDENSIIWSPILETQDPGSEDSSSKIPDAQFSQAKVDAQNPAFEHHNISEDMLANSVNRFSDGFKSGDTYICTGTVRRRSRSYHSLRPEFPIEYRMDVSNQIEADDMFVNEPHIGMEPHAYTPWAQDLRWMYRLAPGEAPPPGTVPGTFEYEKPPTWVPTGSAPNLIIESGHLTAWPWIKSDETWQTMPHVEYEEKWDRFLITPHKLPFHDLRCLPEHPDYLPTRKLCEYQAVETCGYAVWRHDRQVITCTLPSCGKQLVDHDASVQICFGCGPKSGVRYCSKTHLLEDIRGHWEECGREYEVCLPWVVDGDSAPARFSRRYPAIVDLDGQKSYAKLRQRAHSIYEHGQYVLFLGRQELPLVVEFDSEEEARTYRPRVERLLNIALLDERKSSAVAYLFRLLRRALRSTGLWAMHGGVLRAQMRAEFGWDAAATPAMVPEEDACECIWAGDSVDPRLCPCGSNSSSSSAGVVGEVVRGPGLRGLCQELERQHWLLRVWHRQHPLVPAWRERLVGVGFPGVDVEALRRLRPIMGRGWQGNGAVDGLGGWEEDY